MVPGLPFSLPLRRHRTALLFAAFASALLLSAAPIETTQPVRKFVLPTFTAEGYRHVLLRGGEARLPSTNRIEVSDMHLTLFNQQADERVDTVVVSKQATYFPATRSAEGTEGVRIVRDMVEMSGEKWSYSELSATNRKVVIKGRVRAIFQVPINDILK